MVNYYYNTKIEIPKFKLIFCFLLILISFNSISQKPSKHYSSILLVPLRPGMFETDIAVSQHLRGLSKIEKRNYTNTNLVRYSLDKTLFDNLLVYFDIKQLLKYDTKLTRQDLNYIYEATNYRVYKQRLRGFYNNFPNFTIFQVFGSEKKRWGINCMASTELKPLPKNPKLSYTDVVIQDSNLVPYLVKRYNCDYILFVNQVELKTRFKACMNLVSNIYHKDIILHFTLYDKEAEKTIGGLVGITYAPSENDLIEIVEKNFGILSGLVAKVISAELKEPLRVNVDY